MHAPFAKGAAAFLLASLLAVSSPAAEEVPPETVPAAEPGAEAALRGQINDSEGQPLAGATVRVLPISKERTHATVVSTGEDGRFEATGLRGAEFVVRAEAGGFAPTTEREIPAGASVTLHLKKGHAIGGRVYDAASRRPVPGARVRLCDVPGKAFGPEACAAARTDEEGRFDAPDLPEGLAQISAVSRLHAWSEVQTAKLPLSDEDREERGDLEFFLRPGGSLAGRVVDGERRPIEAAVSLVKQEQNFSNLGAGRGLFTRSDDEGQFEFEGVPAGAKYKIRASADGRPAVEVGPFAVEAGSDERDVEVRLLEAARLSVRLVDPDDEPVDDEIQIYLRKASADKPGSFALPGAPARADSIQSSGDGLYTVDALSAGGYTVVIQPLSWQSVEREEVRLRAGETTDLGTVMVEEGEIIGGRVVDPDGGPIAEAKVALYAIRLGAGAQSRQTTTDDAGRYEVGGLAPSTMATLQVSAKGYSGATRQGVAPGDATVDFTLEPAGAVEGRVVTEGGEPVAAFSVQAHPEASGSTPLSFAFGSRTRARVFADKEGSFRLDELAPGEYTLEVKAKGKAPAKEGGIEVLGGETTDAGKITVLDGLTVHGRVLAAKDDAPLIGARVEIGAQGMTTFGAERAHGAEASSDADGRFTLEGLGIGAQDLRIEHPDFAIAEKHVELQADQPPPEVVVRLTRGGRLTGTVRDSAGRPVPDARIMVMPGMKVTDTRSATTDLDGLYEIPRLAPGGYQVMRFTEGGFDPFGGGLKTAAIREGETTIVDFGEESKITLSGTVRRGSTPVGEATLFFVGADGAAVPSNLNSSTSDSAGRYEVGLGSPGTYRVMVQDRAGMFGGSTPVEIVVPDEPQVSMDIVLRLGSVSGAVTDPDGQPVAGAVIGARRDGSSATDATGQSGALTDASGRYRISGLEEGTYRMTATAPGFQVAEKQAVPVGLDGGSAMDFRLERGGTLHGRVVDPQGQGLSGAVVMVASSGIGDSLGAASTQTDVNGAFEISLPSDGPLDVTAIASGWAPVRRGAVIPPTDGAPLVLQASAGGKLRIRVVGPDGEPIGGVTPVVRPTPPFPGSEMIAFFERPLPTDGAGVTLVGRLSPGAYEVTVAGRPNARPAGARVVEGAEAEVLIELPSE